MAPAMEMEANVQILHFVLVPLLAQGHMIPMIDMAKLFAKRGVRVTLVITPNNASRSGPAIRRVQDSGLPIHLLEIPFPGQEVGLPPGCENLDSVPSKDLLRQFYRALDMLQKPLETYLRENEHPPSCIISDKCLSWTSVLYACLGSQCRLIPSQLIQLGLGLEASNQPFIWVIKTGERFSDELDQWLLDEKYEERIKGRGLLIKGWSPQVLILSHPAIKGFLTHCGWNSTIEGICSGVPMITWPMFAEQFLNEVLIVDVLRVGVRVGTKLPVRWGDEEKVGVMVSKEQVENAIEMLMEDGEDGMERRARARELALTAKSAMEVGGSTDLNISLLINDITGQVRRVRSTRLSSSLYC